VFVTLIEDATVEWAPYIRAYYLKANPTATPSEFDWYNIELRALASESFLTVVVMLAITFIGLYIGSQLKKPTRK